MFSDKKIDLELNSVAHLNSFIFLVFSYCTKSSYKNSGCKDEVYESFLDFMLYGNLILFSFISIVSILYTLKILDSLAERLNAVSVTLGAIGYTLAVMIYDFVAIIYSLKLHYFETGSECKELELFTKVCANIFILWLFTGIYDIFMRFRKKPEKEENKYFGF